MEEAYSRRSEAGDDARQCHATKCGSVNNAASLTHTLTHRPQRGVIPPGLCVRQTTKQMKNIENVSLSCELFSSQLLSRHSCFALMALLRRGGVHEEAWRRFVARPF